MKNNTNLYHLGAFLSLSFILSAFSLKYFYNLTPCPLCILQQILMASLFILFLFKARKLIYIFAILGLLVAGRQIWLQFLSAEQVTNCGAPIVFLLENFEFLEILNVVWGGVGDCAKVDWVLFELSLSQWSFIGFLILLVVNKLATYGV